MRKLRLRRRTCCRTRLVRQQSSPPAQNWQLQRLFSVPRNLCRMDSPAGRGRKEPAAPSWTRSTVPSPEPGHDLCTGGPKHPILQEKGALYCMRQRLLPPMPTCEGDRILEPAIYKGRWLQSCPTLCGPMNCSSPAPLSMKFPRWVATLFSRGSSQPRDQIQVSALQVYSLMSESPESLHCYI